VNAAIARIAIVSENTLEALGLADIIARMMPKAEVLLFGSFAELTAEGGAFFHYFVSSSIWFANTAYFSAEGRRTIVLCRGPLSLPRGCHAIDVGVSEEELLRSIMNLARHGHGAHADAVPESVRSTVLGSDARLTPREIEVLRGIASGLLNKEIAHRMNVGLSTVITHRKNLTRKLGVRSASALTVYAVMNGIADVESAQI